MMLVIWNCVLLKAEVLVSKVSFCPGWLFKITATVDLDSLRSKNERSLSVRSDTDKDHDTFGIAGSLYDYIWLRTGVDSVILLI